VLGDKGHAKKETEKDAMQWNKINQFHFNPALSGREKAVGNSGCATPEMHILDVLGNERLC
jgi:hypothetical protein